MVSCPLSLRQSTALITSILTALPPQGRTIPLLAFFATVSTKAHCRVEPLHKGTILLWAAVAHQLSTGPTWRGMFAQPVPRPILQPSPPAWQRLPAAGSRLMGPPVPGRCLAVAVQAESKQPELAQHAEGRPLQAAPGLLGSLLQ